MVSLRVDLPPQAVPGGALLPDTSIYNDLFPVQGRSATLSKGGATAKTAGDQLPAVLNTQHASIIYVPIN